MCSSWSGPPTQSSGTSAPPGREGRIPQTGDVSYQVQTTRHVAIFAHGRGAGTGRRGELAVRRADKKGMQLGATSRLGSHKFGVSCLSDPSVTIGIVFAFHLCNASYLLKASPRNVIKASSRVGPLV